MSKPVPWIIRYLPHLITAAFVLVAIPVTYSSTFSDVSPAHYHRLAGVIEDHPALAQDVADALEDEVITHMEYVAIVDEGQRLSALDARARLVDATESSLAIHRALSESVPLSAHP